MRLLVAMIACTWVPGADTLLRPGNVVLLGEIHGTEEGPDAVAQLVCLALDKGLEVTVGLEIPVAEQSRVDGFLSGGEASKLLAGPFWSRDYQDGRSSAAMMALLSKLQAFRRETPNAVEVVLIDDREAEGGRDRGMTERLAEQITGAAGRLFIVLTGNVHNRLSMGTPFDSKHEPMGFLLSRRLPRAAILSLRITHGGGSAWVCTGAEPRDCGVRELTGREGAPGIELYDEDEPFSGRYHVDRITASPPAHDAR